MSKSSRQHNQDNYYNYQFGLEKIKRVFDFQTQQDLKILDLGCGDGRLLEELKKIGHVVTGVDANQHAVEKTKQKNINAICADLEQTLPFEDQSFDIVLLLDTLEHLVDQQKILNEVNRILKSDGKLIISYPNHFDLRNRFRMLFGRGIIHWAHTKFENAKPWSYGHLRFLLYKELLELLKLTKFYPKKVQFNFMAGGIIPRRLTLPFCRKLMLKIWPQLLTGKYVVLADKQPGEIKQKIYLSSTPKNF